MADAFTGEIRIFGGNFNPRLWAFCNGQFMAISQNTALYSVIGINFGGDGRSTMQMPNLCGRTPMGTNRGPGLSTRFIGQAVGYEAVTMDERHVPGHTHGVHVNTELADLEIPASDSVLANASKPRGSQRKPLAAYAAPESPTNSMNPAMIGSNQTAATATHENRQPFLAMNYIICLEGIYPSRS